MKPCPTRHDAAVFEAAFAAFWPKIWRYLKQNPEITDVVEQEWKTSAHKVLDKNFEEDGYQLGRDFDSENWDVDAGFVEMIDDWASFLYRAHSEAKAAWVASEGIKPKLKVGTKVKVECRRSKFEKSDIRDGEINDTQMGRGEYSVFVESLGHIRPHGRQSGVTGLFVPFAELEALNPMAVDVAALEVPLDIVDDRPLDIRNPADRPKIKEIIDAETTIIRKQIAQEMKP